MPKKGVTMSTAGWPGSPGAKKSRGGGSRAGGRRHLAVTKAAKNARARSR